MAEVLVHQERAIWRKEGLGKVGIELSLVAQDLHAPTAQDVGGANQHGEADGFHRPSNVVGRGPRGAARHAQAGTLREGLEALAVARLVNRIAAGPENIYVCARGR